MSISCSARTACTPTRGRRLAIAAIAAVAARVPARVVVACAAAYGSHPLLDWLGHDTNPPIGIMALWPFSSGYYTAPIPILLPVSRRFDWPDLRSHNLKVVSLEIPSSGPSRSSCTSGADGHSRPVPPRDPAAGSAASPSTRVLEPPLRSGQRPSTRVISALAQGRPPLRYAVGPHIMSCASHASRAVTARGRAVLRRPRLRRPDRAARHRTRGSTSPSPSTATTMARRPGEVRRFLGDALGRPTFGRTRHGSRALLAPCPAALVDLLDRGSMPGCRTDRRRERLARVVRNRGRRCRGCEPLGELVEACRPDVRAAVAAPERVSRERSRRQRPPFSFADCSVGNLVFAGCYLLAAATSTRAVDDYCALLGLPPGLIENVTDGTNAFLVAIDADGRLLGSEEAIVDAKRRNRDRRHLPARPRRRSRTTRTRWRGRRREARRATLTRRAAPLALNPRLRGAIRARRSDHLRARHAAFEPVPVVPDARA